MEIWEEREDAVVVRINHSEFDGDIRKWQELYFKILCWKNTWSMAYEVDMNSYHDNTAYAYIVAKRKVKDQLLEWLESIGYNKECIHATDAVVGTFELYGDEDILQYYPV